MFMENLGISENFKMLFSYIRKNILKNTDSPTKFTEKV